MRVYAVIMAGGVGSRFWPKSRETMPKQFQSLFGDKSLYRRTYERISNIVAAENVLVVTNEVQRDIAVEQLPDFPEKNVIAEPFGRNTAPCIAVAASAVSSMSEDGVMVVLPSDHLISEEEHYISQLKDAIRLADKEHALVTLGIKPTHPERGFGYIHYDVNTDNQDIKMHGGRKVLEFKEKPDQATAAQYLQKGDYLWNSGMFIWRIDVILDELRKNLTHFGDFWQPLRDSFGSKDFATVLKEFYLRVESISVDYAVMERAKNVLTIPSNFTWSDVGSWDEAYRLNDRDGAGNSYKGNIVGIQSKNNYVWAQDRLFALVGVEDLIVVEAKDAVLICKRGKSQQVKEIVGILRKDGRQELI
ncbi:MAG: sugar phosphate nucleotidyltransferase [Bacteroidetes bacterium]|nr:sugar phosphate nucleotidyltransferase [Bacteroidota bacterium]